MVFEGLNHAGVTDAISALNDNAIGIDPRIGSLKELLFDIG
jgi:deoxyxylulose-5-phosphate synthase